MGSMLPYIAAPWIPWVLVSPKSLEIPLKSHELRGEICDSPRVQGCVSVHDASVLAGKTTVLRRDSKMAQFSIVINGE